LTIIAFTLFSNLLYFYGRSIIIILSKLFHKNLKAFQIGGLNISTFYPLISLFIIGNITFIYNFLFPTKYLIYIIFPIIFVNFLDLDFLDLNDYKFFDFLIFPLILGISTSNIGLHFDAGLYHLNFQYWLRESNLVVGLSNIYAPYGWSSINEYISSIFWINENFIIIHFVQLVFILQFFIFIFHTLMSDNNYLRYSSLFVISYGILDNFGINGGVNGFLSIQSIGKFDVSFGILFYIFSILVLDSISQKRYDLKTNLFITFMFIFCFQMKLTGLICSFLYFIYAYKFIRFKKIKINSYFRQNLAAIFISIFWIIKNILQTGCLFFGLEQSCLNISWYQSGYSNAINIDTKEFNNAYFIGGDFLDWFTNWSNLNFIEYFLSNFLISFFLILFLRLIFVRKFKNFKNLLSMNIFIFLNIILWITGAPNPRFGYGFFILIFGVLGYGLTLENKNLSYLLNNKKILVSLFFISLILTPRFSSYSSSIESLNEFRVINPPQVTFEKSQFWGEVPLNGECWVNLLCNKSNKNLNEGQFLIFKSFS